MYLTSCPSKVLTTTFFVIHKALPTVMLETEPIKKKIEEKCRNFYKGIALTEKRAIFYLT